MNKRRLVRGVAVVPCVLAVVLWAGHLSVAQGEGARIGSRPTKGTISSDFNGDGFADLAVGTYLEDVDTAADAGAVNVLYGSAVGLQADEPQDQLWTQDSPDVEDESEEGDGFGWSLATGDFNGDGFGDLAIGSPFEDLGSVANAGAVHVLFGSDAGLQADNPGDQLWTRDALQGEGNAEAGDIFGRSVATGDFNGDGLSELAIGIPHHDAKPGSDAGGVHVLYGSTAGLLAGEQLWTLNSPDVEGVAQRGDLLGWALASGDFNGDGFGDLAMGVPLEDLDTLISVGAVHVLYGSPTGLQAISPADQQWTQDSPDVEDQAEDIDEFGAVLVAGDFNADGVADLAVAVTAEDVALAPAAAAVSVLYGSPGGLQATSPADQFWTQDAPDVQDEAEPFDRFGWSLATDDFNGDGFDDLAVGIRLEDLEVLKEVGAVSVLFGSPGGLQATSPEDQFWTQDSPEVEDDAEFGDRYGRSLGAADYNGDGIGDLAVGIPAENVAGAAIDAGAVNVLYGSPGALQGTTLVDQFWTQNSPEVEDDGERDDWFGYSLASGG